MADINPASAVFRSCSRASEMFGLMLIGMAKFSARVCDVFYEFTLIDFLMNLHNLDHFLSSLCLPVH